ncbi:ATP-binding protein [Candidatus Cryosericum septentrionale]|jgi:Mrp family chromosome partitioning ATPase|uniref:Iron-sulfur cluster carrier protein n=2 Tax=Candidatus Cryosericum septentrionale TaxID=2290913 RepID=A0A398DWW6_9BACT|nr:ATP-binding protein [Candidatus Cryosericum septentrionale]
MSSQVNHVRHVLAVASGKGGVGKSLVSAMAAVELARCGLKVGIMDADITGPSIPRLFGMTARPASSMGGIIPPETETGVKIISMNLFLYDSGQPVIWRGPLLTSAIKQFWTDVAWGDLDVLIVDLPPGTADVPLTTFESLPVDGILMVTTPQELASMIVEKAAGLAKQMHKPILGIVENMAMVTCPHCGEAFELFGPSHAEELADHIGAPVLARLPIDPTVTALADTGHVEDVKMAAFAPVAEALAEYVATPSTVPPAPNPAPAPKVSCSPCSGDSTG